MKRIISLLTLLIVVCIGASAQSLIGKWKTYLGEDKQSYMIYDFRQDGSFNMTLVSVEVQRSGKLKYVETTKVSVDGAFQLYNGETIAIWKDLENAKYSVTGKASGGTAAENKSIEQQFASNRKQAEEYLRQTWAYEESDRLNLSIVNLTEKTLNTSNGYRMITYERVVASK